MLYKNSILALSLVVLAGCSNSYRITYDSDPQGATLICSGENEGYTPVKIDYLESGIGRKDKRAQSIRACREDKKARRTT